MTAEMTRKVKFLESQMSVSMLVIVPEILRICKFVGVGVGVGGEGVGNGPPFRTTASLLRK